MESSEIYPNYRYWQEKGGFWVEEYARRKRTQVFYDIQEFMLAEYIERCAPARVLEFGCGVGRHLKYLRNIQGIEIYGYDQSPTMLEGIHQWADETWFEKHITLGDPVGRLPYQDKSFDIVFTAEVLLHIRPEDLNSVLSEFLRISKWQIYHLEPAPDYVVTPYEHGGCWNHDLVHAYASLGYLCEVMPKGFRAQLPSRVIMDNSRSTPPSINSIQKLLELEEDIQPTLDTNENYTNELKRDFEQRSVQYEKYLEEAKKQSINLKNEIDHLLEDIRDKEHKIECMNVELNYVDSLFSEMKNKKIGRLLWPWFTQRHPAIKIFTLGQHNPSSQGSEVWILSIKSRQYPFGIPLKYLQFNPKRWKLTEDAKVPLGYLLVALGKAQLSIPIEVDETLQIALLSHSWSGLIGVEVQGRMTIVDLYHETHRSIAIFPFQNPMDITELR